MSSYDELGFGATDYQYECTKYGEKWLCPPENDTLECKDCIWSRRKEESCK